MTTKTIINNHLLGIAVSSSGAELRQFIRRRDNTELLWQGDPAHWARRAPVLFPIVGRLKGDQFTYRDQTYPMSQHGFARDAAFELVERDEHSLVYELHSRARSLDVYPFHFHLKITYQLIDNTLHVHYLVVNNYSEPLYFSIGGHPAFNVPLFPQTQRSDYRLVFNRTETAHTQLLTDGLRNGTQSLILDHTDTLPLTDTLFDQDALIFKDLESNSVTLMHEEEPLWTFDFTGFPYLGIWSKSRTSPFVCIEPWHGIADHTDHNGDFTQKEGIKHLAPREYFECSYRITVH